MIDRVWGAKRNRDSFWLLFYTVREYFFLDFFFSFAGRNYFSSFFFPQLIMNDSMPICQIKFLSLNLLLLVWFCDVFLQMYNSFSKFYAYFEYSCVDKKICLVFFLKKSGSNSCCCKQWHLKKWHIMLIQIIIRTFQNGSQTNGNERLEKLHVYLFN